MHGGLISIIFYTILFFINKTRFNFTYAIMFFVFGIITGILIIIFLERKRKKLYFSRKFTSWMILFIQINLLFGIITGLIIGILGSWFLLFPFSFLFGHPESSEWKPIVTYSFKTLSMILSIFSFLIVAYWFLKGSIIYLEKKITRNVNGEI